MSLVDTNWLESNLSKVKIIDCSWHMPQTKRDGFEEYKNKHIQNALFFDLDINSNQNTSLPHMLVELSKWEMIVSKMGIENERERTSSMLDYKHNVLHKPILLKMEKEIINL